MRATLKNYKQTQLACYLGFVTQAITANFTPLLFISFHREYGVPITRLALIPGVFYVVQLVVDFLCARFARRLDYRKGIVLSEITSALGLIGLTFVPALTSDPFVGILLCVAVYAMGSGLIEVLCSPIIEACPFPNKESMMSLLHSFYCWGAVAVILGSTLFFTFFGLDNWRILAVLWALLPLYNIYNFATCPIEPVVPDNKGMKLGALFKSGIFWVCMLLMVAAGASESIMAQWTSAFAEDALGVGKTVGDLAGPCGFAFCMGLSRLWYGKYGARVKLPFFMLVSGVLCLASYLLAAFSALPALALAGCMSSGLAVGIMWPGTISLSSARIPTGGTALFAMLALCGDLGGSTGPALVGVVSRYAGDDLQTGIVVGAVFAILLISCILVLMLKTKESCHITKKRV